METFSALLAICAGNSPVFGEIPAQRPVTRSFDVFFDLRLNKRLSKQSWGWWFKTLPRPLWHHSNIIELPLKLGMDEYYIQAMDKNAIYYKSMTKFGVNYIRKRGAYSTAVWFIALLSQPRDWWPDIVMIRGMPACGLLHYNR